MTAYESLNATDGNPQIDSETGQNALGLVDETVDISLAEIAERLVAEREVTVDPSTIWYFFRRRAITYKKRRRMPVSRIATTSA